MIAHTNAIEESYKIGSRWLPIHKKQFIGKLLVVAGLMIRR